MTDLSKMNGVPVCWLTSKLRGKNCTTFVKPELKADRILIMLFLGHEDISEPWAGIGLEYLGSFDPGDAPF
jgi:hypothetical protein